MKFCPKCGFQLEDHANFCPKCGSKQPDSQVVEQPVQEVKAAPVNNPQPQQQTKSPSQRYNDLVKNDEVFREIVLVRRKKYLFELTTLLFVIPWLVALLTPVALLNGINVSTQGAQILSVAGLSTPLEVNPYFLITLDALRTKYDLIPGGGLNASFAVIALIVGIIFTVLSVLMPILKAFTGRGYVLKMYEEGKVKALIKETVRPYWYGGLLCIFVATPSLNLYLSAANAEYEAGKTYIFGEMEEITSGFIAVVVVALIVAAIIITLNAVLGHVFSRKLKEYEKNL